MIEKEEGIIDIRFVLFFGDRLLTLKETSVGYIGF